jgi:hypothetical protein
VAPCTCNSVGVTFANNEVFVGVVHSLVLVTQWFDMALRTVFVVSTGAKFVEQTWTTVVRAALDQSGLPAFLLYSGRLFHQVMSASAHRLERAPAGPALAPPP